ncbi:hypothetical protein KCU83_g4708, partial [Aureobasidium melanogenum]
MSPPIETHWYDDKAYSTKPDLKQEIEAAVRAQAPADASAAYIVSGWHKSRSDNRNHGTVDYDRGESVERRHIYPR